MGAAGKQRVNPSQAIIAVNIRRFAIQNTRQEPILKFLLVVLAILTTMRWLRRLMGYTKQRSFGIAAQRSISEVEFVTLE